MTLLYVTYTYLYIYSFRAAISELLEESPTPHFIDDIASLEANNPYNPNSPNSPKSPVSSDNMNINELKHPSQYIGMYNNIYIYIYIIALVTLDNPLYDNPLYDNPVYIYIYIL